VSVSDLRDAFLSRAFTSYVDCDRCHAVLKLRRARAITIGLSVVIGVIFLGGSLGEHFLTPAAQRIGGPLALLPFFAYIWLAPLLCRLELCSLPDQVGL
jgi:hypothetical protein